MKTLLYRTLLFISLVPGNLFFSGCGDTNGDGTTSLPEITALIIHNRSQFEIEHLFVYNPSVTYQESTNLIASNLEVNELIFHELQGGEYLVTVTRRQNATGDLLAYTMTEPILLNRPKVVEYYDTEFRVYDLKLTIPTEAIELDDNSSTLTSKRLNATLGTTIYCMESPVDKAH